jgi:hypothetical protein
MDQALAAYRLLAGPKRLYLGDLGHPPAKNPAAEVPAYLSEAVAWLGAYLVGGPKLGGGIELGHDPWRGTTSFFKSPPATRRVSVNLPGKKKLASNASAVRSVRLAGGPLETFGDGYLTVRYSGNHGYGALVASVTVKGSSTPVTFGAAHVTKSSGVLRIPLSDQALLLPRGKRLVAAVGGKGVSGVYLPPNAKGGSITIGRVTLNLSLLKHAVSK